jgi:hypothetical protein
MCTPAERCHTGGPDAEENECDEFRLREMESVCLESDVDPYLFDEKARDTSQHHIEREQPSSPKRMATTCPKQDGAMLSGWRWP